MMMTINKCTTLLLALLFIMQLTATVAFAPLPSWSYSSADVMERHPSVTRVNMIFGPPKDDGSPGDYVCKDCGYVFTKGPKAWAELPDNYKCPPCGAPKFRFKKVPKGSASGKVDVKKSWFGK